MAKAITSAIIFMRDNVNGNFVTKGNVHGRDGDGVIYKTVDGITYILNAEELKKFDRYGFKPRYLNPKKED
jgi:hypothetical protein